MTLANASAVATDGSIIATHTVGTRELLVNLPADNLGHLIGSRTEWLVMSTAVTNAAGAEVLEIFNAAVAGTIVRVRGVWIIPTQTDVTGVQIAYDLNRISTVGSTSSTVETPRPTDTGFAALPAGITTRRGSTVGGTLVYKYLSQWNWNENQDIVNSPAWPQLANQVMSMTNLLPLIGDDAVELVFAVNEGLQLKVSSGAAGLTAALMYFAVDN